MPEVGRPLPFEGPPRFGKRIHMKHFAVGVLMAVTLLAATERPAFAQRTVTDIISFLVTNQSIPTGDAARDRAAAEVARDAITRALVVNLTSVPIATSSS